MSVVNDRWQRREAVATLLEKGDEQGYLTATDVLAVFPDLEDAADRMERLQAFFPGAGIEVYKGSADVPENLRPEARPVIVEEPFDLSTISTDDTVGLYLKEMSRGSLLPVRGGGSRAAR